MRICLIPLLTDYRDPRANIRRVEERLTEVSSERPDLVCLPEATLTGYLYEEDDLHRFAEPIPGPTTERMGKLARDYGVFLCFGLIEAAGDKIYDSAVLLDRNGRIALRHRKIEERPPFATGDSVSAAGTELGRLSIVICGDLFNADVIRKLDRDIDLLLVPMARSFPERSPDRKRWEREERGAYLNAVRRTGTTAVLVNALESGGDDLPSFGGALLVDGEGTLLAESPHGTDRPLIYDLPRRSWRSHPGRKDRATPTG